MPPMPPDLLRRPLRPDPAVLRSRLPAPPPLPAPRRPHPIHWPAVGVASAVCLLVLGGLSAWLATHPGKARQRPAPVPLAASPAPVIHVNALDREPLEVTPVDEPQPPRGGVRFANLTPPAAPAAQPPRPGIRILRPVQLANLAHPPGAPACRTENYGTSVKFLGSPQEAARAARREQKLLFVLHISGNFEDQQFT